VVAAVLEGGHNQPSLEQHETETAVARLPPSALDPVAREAVATAAAPVTAGDEFARATTTTEVRLPAVDITHVREQVMQASKGE